MVALSPNRIKTRDARARACRLWFVHVANSMRMGYRMRQAIRGSFRGFYVWQMHFSGGWLERHEVFFCYGVMSFHPLQSWQPWSSRQRCLVVAPAETTLHPFIEHLVFTKHSSERRWGVNRKRSADASCMEHSHHTAILLGPTYQRLCQRLSFH